MCYDFIEVKEVGEDSAVKGDSSIMIRRINRQLIAEDEEENQKLKKILNRCAE